MRNYGFRVIDLGKDVAGHVIVDTAIKENAQVIGLSALMTTTMQQMRHVIDYAKEREIEAKIIIGGAVITEEYAQEIGADGDSKDAAEGFKNDNPLANSDNYEVYMADVAKQKDVVAFAEGLEGVRKVNKSDVVAKTLTSVNKLVGYISVAIIVILLAVSVFLISNTVTMGITVRREEIAIMKYIGAKDGFVRAPFVFEGLLIGIVGAIIPLTMLYFMYDKAVDYIMGRFSLLNNIIDFLPVVQVYRILLPVGIALGVGIGFVGSFFTIRKHLKV